MILWTGWGHVDISSASPDAGGAPWMARWCGWLLVLLVSGRSAGLAVEDLCPSL